jgi:hypothetical protein
MTSTRYGHIFPVGSEPQSGRSEDGVADSEPRDIATDLDHDSSEVAPQDRAPRPNDAEYQMQRQPEPFDRKRLCGDDEDRLFALRRSREVSRWLFMTSYFTERPDSSGNS